MRVPWTAGIEQWDYATSCMQMESIWLGTSWKFLRAWKGLTLDLRSAVPMKNDEVQWGCLNDPVKGFCGGQNWQRNFQRVSERETCWAKVGQISIGSIVTFLGNFTSFFFLLLFLLLSLSSSLFNIEDKYKKTLPPLPDPEMLPHPHPHLRKKEKRPDLVTYRENIHYTQLFFTNPKKVQRKTIFLY